MNNKRNRIADYRRIVVKVGTSTLTYDTGMVNLLRMEKLAMTLSDQVNQGKEVILVTSGAIGLGMGKLKLKEKPHTVRGKQAVAAVGQCELMHLYSKFFGEYGYVVGQILLTRDVVEDGHKRQNVINTFETLIEKGIIPIVNENDSVAIDEIEHGETEVFGDNDTLSAIVADIIEADLLIILSDIDGFYNSDPKTNGDSKMYSIIEAITPELEKYAGGAGSKIGTGGMITKLSAAKIATSAGVDMVLCNGSDPEIISDVLNCKEVGTFFISNKEDETIDRATK